MRLLAVFIAVDFGHADAAPRDALDFACAFRTGASCAPAPGLDRGFGNAERLSGGFVAYGLDVIGKVHAYGL